MRQALLVTGSKHGSRSSPIVLWMDDTTRVGDEVVWRGDYWVVSALYGTHFSTNARVEKCDRPHRAWDKGDGFGLPLDP